MVFCPYDPFLSYYLLKIKKTGKAIQGLSGFLESLAEMLNPKVCNNQLVIITKQISDAGASWHLLLFSLQRWYFHHRGSKGCGRSYRQ